MQRRPTPTKLDIRRRLRRGRTPCTTPRFRTGRRCRGIHPSNRTRALRRRSRNRPRRRRCRSGNARPPNRRRRFPCAGGTRSGHSRPTRRSGTSLRSSTDTTRHRTRSRRTGPQPRRSFLRRCRRSRFARRLRSSLLHTVCHAPEIDTHGGRRIRHGMLRHLLVRNPRRDRPPRAPARIDQTRAPDHSARTARRTPFRSTCRLHKTRSRNHSARSNSRLAATRPLMTNPNRFPQLSTHRLATRRRSPPEGGTSRSPCSRLRRTCIPQGARQPHPGTGAMKRSSVSWPPTYSGDFRLSSALRPTTSRL